ncbi:MAG: cytosolic protein [Desulfobacteraceae bacterium]|nr:cytosolic protein [Desulfobacteraceae bacterium]
MWALIHADVQSQREESFPERMYIYNYRLFDRYRRHAASFAVLGDTGKKWRPDNFEKELWGCRIRFEFPAVKLSDYGKDREALKADKNPFAIVVMAHLLTQKTAKDYDRRKKEKLTLIRQLYHKGFSKQDIINLFRFIDWIMDLPEIQEKLFWQEFTDTEEEKTMRYMTTGERIGYKRGIEEGIQQGMQQGVQQGFLQAFLQQTTMVAKQLAKKFRSQPEDELPKLRMLKSDDLMELGGKTF